MFSFVGEVFVFYIVDIVLYRAGDDGVEVGVAAKESGGEIVVYTQHVVHYENLSVYTTTCTNAYDGYGEFLCYAGCQVGGYFFELKGFDKNKLYFRHFKTGLL